MDPLEELPHLFAHFVEEIAEIFPEIGGGDGHISQLPAIRRPTLVRAVFAHIEAVSSNLKYIALHEDRETNTLTEAERSICTEQTFRLNNKGEIEDDVHKLRLLANIRFAFRAASKARGLADTLDVSGSGWQKLQEGIKIRDRLTHPKRVSDLTVTDDELLTVVVAGRYIHEQLTGWMSESRR